jgi:hypothetical protein
MTTNLISEHGDTIWNALSTFRVWQQDTSVMIINSPLVAIPLGILLLACIRFYLPLSHYGMEGGGFRPNHWNWELAFFKTQLLRDIDPNDSRLDLLTRVLIGQAYYNFSLGSATRQAGTLPYSSDSFGSRLLILNVHGKELLARRLGANPAALHLLGGEIMGARVVNRGNYRDVQATVDIIVLQHLNRSVAPVVRNITVK